MWSLTGQSSCKSAEATRPRRERGETGVAGKVGGGGGGNVLDSQRCVAGGGGIACSLGLHREGELEEARGERERAPQYCAGVVFTADGHADGFNTETITRDCAH